MQFVLIAQISIFQCTAKSTTLKTQNKDEQASPPCFRAVAFLFATVM